MNTYAQLRQGLNKSKKKAKRKIAIKKYCNGNTNFDAFELPNTIKQVTTLILNSYPTYQSYQLLLIDNTRKLSHRIINYNFDTSSKINKSWLYAQADYINNLPLRDKLLIAGYTKHGDITLNNFHHNNGKLGINYFDEDFVPFISNWKRQQHQNNVYFPFFMEVMYYIRNKNRIFIYNMFIDQFYADYLYTNKYADYDSINQSDIYQSYHLFIEHFHKIGYNYWKDIVKLATKRFNFIIKHSPKCKTKLTVYRGTQNNYFFSGKKGGMYKNKTYVSTSLSNSKVVDFMNNDTGCCYQKISILPNSNILFMIPRSQYPQEAEILIGNNSYYVIKEHKKYNTILQPESICDSIDVQHSEITCLTLN